MPLFLALVLLLSAALPVSAKVIVRDIEYTQGGAILQGYLAHDTRFSGKRPGIIIAHQWKGLGEYEKRRARMLAEMGYVAFALDIYGKGVRPDSAEKAREQAGKYRANRPLLRNRARAAVIALRKQPNVDVSRLAAIGYCFGGGTVLELARSGADLKAFVSFHGNLDTPDPSLAKDTKGQILVLHGAADPHVKPEQIQAFTNEMNAAKNVDWRMISYGHAVHSFTEKEAGNDPSDGSAYNQKADVRSWAAMKRLFAEVF